MGFSLLMSLLWTFSTGWITHSEFECMCYKEKNQPDKNQGYGYTPTEGDNLPRYLPHYLCNIYSIMLMPYATRCIQVRESLAIQCKERKQAKRWLHLLRCEQAGCNHCLRQPVLPSPCLSCSSQCTPLYQCLQVAASRRLRNVGEFPVHGIRNHAMLSNVLHCLLHAPFLLEQQGLTGRDIGLPRHCVPERPAGRGDVSRSRNRCLGKGHDKFTHLSKLRRRETHPLCLLKHQPDPTPNALHVSRYVSQEVRHDWIT